MVLLGDVGQVEVYFGLFGEVLILAQDWWMGCPECAMSMETISGAPDGTPR
jgi:hypothetical protein